MSKEVFGALEWLLSTTKSLVSQKPVRNLDEVLSHCEKVVNTHAAANKAAEEGGLPVIATWQERRADWLKRNSQKREGPPSNDPFTQAEIKDLRESLDADRASRQVANKADVDLSSLQRYDESESRLIPTPDGEYVVLSDVKALLAAPPATTGASTAPTDPSLPRDMTQAIEWIVGLRARVDSLLDVIEAEREVGASTVLADKRIPVLRIMRIAEECDIHTLDDRRTVSFGRAIEREVAAQAGHDDDADVADLYVRDALGDQYDPEVGEAVSVLRIMAAWKAEAQLGEKYKQMALGAAKAGQVAVPLPAWRGIKAVLTNLIAVASIRIADKDDDDDQLIDDAAEAVRQLDAAMQGSTSGESK